MELAERREGIPFAALGLLTIAPILWGGNFVIGRVVSPDIGANWLNILRWTVAAVVLLPFGLPGLIRDRRALWRDRWKLSGLSLFCVVGFNTLLYIALQTATVAQVAIGFAMSPFVIMFLVSVLDQQWPAKQVLGAAGISMAGVVLAKYGGLAGAPFHLESALITGAATLVWSIYCIALKRFRLEAPALSTFTAQILIGLVCQSAFALTILTPMDFQSVSAQGWFAILYLGIFSSAIAFLCWQSGIRRSVPEAAGVFLNLVPLSSIFLAAFFLAEAITQTEAIGIALIFLGVFAASRHGRRRTAPEHELPG